MPPAGAEQAEWLARVHAGRALHRSWVSPHSTPATFRAYLGRMADPAGNSFLVCQAETDSMAGAINVTGIVRGLFCSGHLGY